MLSRTVIVHATREALCPALLEMPETTVNVDALYAALDTKRRSQESSWREIARDSTSARPPSVGWPTDVARTWTRSATLLRWLNVDAEAL
jgi:hypothetical protein